MGSTAWLGVKQRGGVGQYSRNQYCSIKCSTRYILYVIVIAQRQGFMAVNQPESEGKAQGQGRFMLP